MPGDDANYSEAPNLYPKNEDDYRKLLSWCSQAFLAAEAASQDHRQRWRRHNRLYRSYLKRDRTNWRSQVFIPYTFSFIEGIVPKLLAEPPKPVVSPIEEMDTYAAKMMEGVLDRAVVETKLHMECIKVGKSSLKYGTGILKTFWKQDIKTAWEKVPVMEPVPVTSDPTTPVIGPDGQPMQDMNGQPVMGGAPAVQPGAMQPKMNPQTGQPVYEVKPYEYIGYEGPAAEWVDLFRFYVAPEAEDIQDARYVIQQSFRDMDYLRAKVKEGMYQLPPDVNDVEDLLSDRFQDPREVLRQEVEGDSATHDDTDKPVELWEFWLSDGRLITVANRRALIRVQASPYWHGMKPFVRVVDYLQEGQFWGVGEIEAIEGLQDVQNAIWNQRIDNVRLAMDRQKAVHVDSIVDENDLNNAPGNIVRVTGDRHPSEALYFWETPDVTGSAYQEALQIEQMMERTTGLTAYTAGLGSSTLNRTATGVALITEQGNTKFAHKVLMFEMQMVDVFKQWGGLVQQFMDEPKAIRLMGPSGQVLFATLQPDAVQGALDYTIEAKSTSQTETARKEQAQSRLMAISSVWPTAIPKLVMDMLEADGIKDVSPYLWGVPDLEMLLSQQIAMQQMQAMQGAAGQQQGPAGPPDQGQGPPPDQGGNQQDAAAQPAPA